MRRQLTALGAAFGAAAVIAAIAATSSLALSTANTWTVKPGGGYKATASGQIVLENTKTQFVISCSKSALAGDLKKGSGVAGKSIGTISSFGAKVCATSFNNAKVGASDLPWQLNASSYASGATEGTITGVHLYMSTPGCDVVVDGTSANAADGKLSFKYSNSAGTLTTSGGNLHFYKVAGCKHLIKAGDPATLDGTYKLNPKQKLTSP